MKKERLRKIILFSILGTIMFISKLLMEFLPNIHPVAMLIAVYTLVYRSKALIPIYLYVFLCGVYGGFNIWWISYLYIWTVLWALIMLIPKKASDIKKGVLSCIMCGLHGILFGTMCAPIQAIFFGLNFEGTITWIIAGLPWDLVHMCGNIAMSGLVIPLYRVLLKTETKRENFYL